MADWAIRAHKVGKSYKILSYQAKRSYKTLQEDVLAGLKKLCSRERGRKSDTFWALRDLSVDIKQGEMVGIIGPNGAGKSTLLKLISRVTEPTTGRIDVYGRLGPLLEVGTGFHPELSGKENIFLSGAILGMKKSEIKRRFDEIIDFAGVEKFLETPIKRYSSGMYLRLAFSVMAHLDADILIVDEVLAVGDAAFQKKCLGKMEGRLKEGKTILFVSHQLESIASFCPRSLLIKEGQLIFDGPTKEVIDRYLTMIREKQGRSLNERKDRIGLGRFRFTDIWIENDSGQIVDILHSGGKYRFVLSYENNSEQYLRNMSVSIGLSCPSIPFIANFGVEEFNRTLDFAPRSKGIIVCEIKKLPLNSGIFYYNLMARASQIGAEIEDFVTNAGSFTTEPGKYFDAIVPKHGFLLIDHSWEHVSEEPMDQVDINLCKSLT
ncbi:MAG TPA: ABC transporter ATP-binding protein [Chlamydiales bacterium]|nr:ABC transporter ATP-binding protein [Chlamydiales bacterium]